MDIYYGVFNARNNDVSYARNYFVKEFGRETFEKIVAPYIIEGYPGWLFCMPYSMEHVAFINYLCMIVADRTNGQYIPPPNYFMFNEKRVTTSSKCPGCERLIESDFLSKNHLCPICYSRQSNP